MAFESGGVANNGYRLEIWIRVWKAIKCPILCLSNRAAMLRNDFTMFAICQIIYNAVTCWDDYMK